MMRLSEWLRNGMQSLMSDCSSLWQESQFNGLEVFECCLSIAILNLINNPVAKIFTHQEFT